MDRQTDRHSYGDTRTHLTRLINATRIDGFFRPKDVANCFADSFEKVHISNDSEKVSARKFYQMYSSYESCQAHDDISDYFLSWTDKLSIVEKLKKGKVTAGFIKYEHILHGSPKLTFF